MASNKRKNETKIKADAEQLSGYESSWPVNGDEIKSEGAKQCLHTLITFDV